MTGWTRLNFIRTPLYHLSLLSFIFFQFLNWKLLTVNLSWKSSPCFDTWLNLTPLSLLASKPQQLGQILHQGCQAPFRLKTEDLLSSKSISSWTAFLLVLHAFLANNWAQVKFFNSLLKEVGGVTLEHKIMVLIVVCRVCRHVLLFIKHVLLAFQHLHV